MAAAKQKEPPKIQTETEPDVLAPPRIVQPHPLLGADVLYWNRSSDGKTIYAIPGKLVRQNAVDAKSWDLILFMPTRNISDRVAVRIADAPEDRCATLVK